MPSLHIRVFRSSRNQPQPQNLKERIAALEQRNNATPPPSSFSTSTPSSSSSLLTPQLTGGTSALKDKIARFEKKGGVPVPRGSFGLGAPPPAENGQPRRRGELVGNRIPSVKSHPTGPLSAQTTGGYGMMGGVSAHTTGVTAHTTGSMSLTTHMTGSTAVTTPTSAKIPGLEYDEDDESTGGFAPPDSALGVPQGLDFTFAGDVPPSPGPASPLPSSARSTSPPPEDFLTRQQSQSNARRGQAFTAALEFAKKAESENKGVYTRTTSPSPSPPPTASRRYSTFGAAINGDETKEKEETIVSVPNPGFEPPLTTTAINTESKSEASDEVESTPEIVASPVNVASPPKVEAPLPVPERVVSPPPSDIVPDSKAPTSPPKTQSSKVSITSPKSVSSTLSDDSDTTVDGKPVLCADTDEDDSDLFVKPIKRDGHRSPPSPHSTTPNRSLPSTPRDSTVSMPATPNLEVPSSRDSVHTRDSVLSTSTRDSMFTTESEASPSHLAIAHKISLSPVTEKGKAIFIPGAKERERSISTTTATAPPETQIAPVPDNQAQDEFGSNRASTFSAVVHGKVKETYTSHTLPRRAPVPATPQKSSAPETPMSPGFGELALLMAQSALLEQKLTDGGPLEFGIEKRLREEEAQRRRKEEEERRAEEERENEEKLKLKRTPSTKSKDSNRSRKLSLKKAFSKSAKKETPPLPLEPIPSSPGPEAQTHSHAIKAKSKSMEALLTSPPPPMNHFPSDPSPQSLAPPAPRTRSTSASAATSTTTLGGSDSDVPPTPPPKSPNHQNRYIASIRRFASSSGASSAASTAAEKDADSSPSAGGVGSGGVGSGGVSFDDPIGEHSACRWCGESDGSVGSSYFASVGTGTGTMPGSVSEVGVKNGVENGKVKGGNENKEEVTRGGSLKWPSTATSPKKQSKVGRAASFAEKMWNRTRTKSSVSTVSTASTANDSDYEPKVSISGSSTYSFITTPSPSLMPPPSPGPSLHELILSEPLSLSIPEVSEPVSYEQPQVKTPTSTSLSSSLSSSTSSYPDAPRISWISTSSTGTASPLWDKELFDAFPKVPDTTPIPGHSREDSRSTVKLD
ncbi:hypothetical protein VNI00_012146 [Paramarasmius palmivorus]|uniref:Uncharacterized protein n=1 Tax=Paramarasmius palmivorus TaxID=297713 RepID=A0AAW0C7Z7_9AGAR